MPYTSQRWKQQERDVARVYNGTRIPNNGFGQPDVVAGDLAIQVKTRLTLPKWLTDAVDQSILDAGDDKHPVVVLCHVRKGHKTRRLVVVDMDNWKDLTA